MDKNTHKYLFSLFTLSVFLLVARIDLTKTFKKHFICLICYFFCYNLVTRSIISFGLYVTRFSFSMGFIFAYLNSFILPFASSLRTKKKFQKKIFFIFGPIFSSKLSDIIPKLMYTSKVDGFAVSTEAKVHSSQHNMSAYVRFFSKFI